MMFYKLDYLHVNEFAKIKNLSIEKTHVLDTLVKLYWARGEDSDEALELLVQPKFLEFRWSDEDHALAVEFADWLDVFKVC